MLPVICWPHLSLKIVAERFSVPNGPVPSIASTGTAMKVTSAQAIPTRRAAMLPSAPPWFSSSAINRPIAVESAAQPQISAEATAGDGEAVADGRLAALEDHVGGGGEADREVGADDAEHVDADDQHRDRAAVALLVEQVEAGAEEDNRQRDRQQGAVEREADQFAMPVQQRPAFLRQSPTAFDPAHRLLLRWFGRPSQLISARPGARLTPLSSKYSHSCWPSSVAGASA